jgi:hypothetical protein
MQTSASPFLMGRESEGHRVRQWCVLIQAALGGVEVRVRIDTLAECSIKRSPR